MGWNKKFVFLSAVRIILKSNCFFCFNMFKLIFRYLFCCTNRNIYDEIALKHKTTAWNVYRLAHGKKVRSLRDGSIHRELFRQGIIN